MRAERTFRTLLISGILSIAVLGVSGVLVLHNDLKRLKSYFSQHLQQVNKLSNKLSELEKEFILLDLSALSNYIREKEGPLSFVEDPSGLKSVLDKYGITREDLKFIKKNRGALIDSEEFTKDLSLKTLLKEKLISASNKNQSEFEKYELTDRQRLIASTVARVNGSISTYAVKSRYPFHLEDILMLHNGNCSDYTVRLMVALEAIGLKSAMISSVTPSLPGHVFVDAFDPVSNSSFLLDSQWNIMIQIDDSNGKSFFQSLLDMEEANRIQLINSLEIYQFPTYIRFIDPGKAGLSSTPYSTEFLNGQRKGLKKLFKKFLSSDLEELRRWWKNTPNHRPYTLQFMRENNLADIPVSFNYSSGYAKAIIQSAKLNNLKDKPNDN